MFDGEEKTFLPRYSRRDAWQVPTVSVLPTILGRYQFRNAHAKDMSCEVLGVKCGGAQSRRRTFTVLVAAKSLAVVAERFVLKTMFATLFC